MSWHNLSVTLRSDHDVIVLRCDDEACHEWERQLDPTDFVDDGIGISFLINAEDDHNDEVHA